MGKKLDALLGRSFKTTRFKALVNLAISRLAVLANQRQVRASHARSDVVQLLQLGHHERALFRVEQVIKDQKLLDAYAIIESYCEVVLERIKLLEHERECPEEIKEAISGLIFASSRCGDFPELIEIRSVITSRFGKEFTARAIELRNNCAVGPMIVQKLSARPSSLEIKLKLLKQIASEHGITLKDLEAYEVSTEERVVAEEKKEQPQQETKVESVFQILPEEIEKDDRYADSMRGRKKYKDVADAAQAAFESAAYAAAAARAAVELSQSKSLDHDDLSSPSSKPRKSTETLESKNADMELKSENKETHGGSTSIEAEESESGIESKQPISSSSSEAGDASLKENEIPIEAINIIDLLEKDLAFDESDVDAGNGESSSSTLEERNSCFECHKIESESAEITANNDESDNKNTAQNLSIGNEAVITTIDVRGH
ncbi:uncharacterized protein LOC120082250 isoform X2 [Benincasa hispida]|uniref:uncharacterized protein LOC120082250 isoform X2 n=1 Tax=Benincasa hispida TaxID=102211 RepID=UPI0019013662|nr:uncharacterized protein LOC120082250 isoform X2 [Benincasa hispida]